MPEIDENEQRAKGHNPPFDADQKQNRNVDNPLEFTDIVGGNGCWQKQLLLFCIFIEISTCWTLLVTSFFAYPVDYWCAKPTSINMTSEEWHFNFIPNETIAGVQRLSHCNMYEVTNVTNENIANRNITTCQKWEYQGNYNFTITEQWSLVCDSSWMISMSQSVYMGGFLLAVVLSGQLSDTYGRYPVILLNVAIFLVFGALTAFSTSFMMFTVMRFFVAMGSSGLSLTFFVLLMEAVGTEYRTVYAVLSGIGWCAAYATLPLLAWLIQHWMYLQLCIMLPFLSFIAFKWVIDESPRWLLCSGKFNQAVATIEKIAKMNKIEVVDLELQIKLLESLTPKNESNKKSATIIDLFRTTNIRKKTCIMYVTWVVIAFVYFGLTFNVADLGEDVYINFFFYGLVEALSLLFCFFALRYFGRKSCLIFALIVSGIACFTFFFLTESLYWVTVTVAMLGKFFISAAFYIVYIYSAEIFPTVVRNVGIGSSSMMARIGSMIAPFMKEIGGMTSKQVPMIIFGVMSIGSGLLILFLPETKGSPVPETLEHAEEFGRKRRKEKKIAVIMKK